MPVLMRATFFFKDTNGYGWTETIHSKKDGITTTLAAAVSLLPLRRDLLGSTAFIDFVRVSDDLIKRDSKIYVVPPGDRGTRISAQTGADIANTNLVVRLDADPTHRRTLYMRGVPDEAVITSGKYVPNDVFQAAFETWVRELVTNDWAVRSRDNLVTVFAISGYTFNAVNGTVTFTTVGNHNFGVNTAVTIQNLANSARLRGNWAIFGIPTATTFDIKVNFIPPAYSGGGQVSRIAYVLNNIVTGEVRRASHRITGGPFDRPRGRKRGVKRAVAQ